MGLWRCSCVGNERDAVTLTRGNAEASRHAALRLRVPAELTGNYGDPSVVVESLITANWLTEDGVPILTEDSEYFAKE